jgi:peptidoglycan/xylan/chitin deacetylase (PgdA/CDA1 family)
MSILCYHAVEPGWDSALAVSPDLFEKHCAWLSRHRTVLPLEQAIDRMGPHGRLPRGYTALTFDDGFRSLHEHALPVLRRHSLPATVFLVAETLAPGGKEVDWVDHPPHYPMQTLSVEQVAEMQAAGVRFESHSYAHADLTTLGFEDCVHDLCTSKELLETVLGHQVRVLAYPRGRHDAGVRAAAERAGYQYALALPEGPEPVGPYAVPRVGVHHGNTVRHLRLKTTAPYLPLRTGRTYQWVRAARRGATRTAP